MADSSNFPDRHSTDDEWQWLEDINGAEPLMWVDAQNTRTMAAIDRNTMETLESQILDVLDSTDRIPMVSLKGEWLYNFWKDAEHPRGLWRRTTLASYKTSSPEWDVILDVDALGRQEGREWVFAGAELLYPRNERALVLLSPDGGDAFEIREFDLMTRAFVADGFRSPVAKTSVSWIDVDSVLICTDFGPGTLTTSSYPRQVRRWKRGTSLSEAVLVYEAPASHMGVWAEHDHAVGYERDIIEDRVDFYHANRLVVEDGHLRAIDIPDDAEVGLHREWLTIWPRSAWMIGETTWPAGSLLVVRFDHYMTGSRDLEAIFMPDAHTSLVAYSWTRNAILLTVLHDVASQVHIAVPGTTSWNRHSLGHSEPNQTIRVAAANPDESDMYWLIDSGYIQPETLHLGDITTGDAVQLKSAPSFFCGSDYQVSQHFAISADGTAIPYFQIAPRNLVADGTNPTVLYGYGGFEIPLTPGYSGVVGRAWLETGGVYVVANIRGGGEYGPAWHQAALRANRLRAYEDFAAVARDLVEREITTPARLGCIGGSNGGLLVGNMLTHYPDLFGAIVCEVPLLDMRRYTKLSAGTSWIAEYGDPDLPEDWAFIQTFSPYHNIQAGIDYPPVLFYTATSDDRVGPVQARKMAARMQARNIPDVLFYENREGGHGGAANNAQRAHMDAMAWAFFHEHLKSR